jgi:hypothetical protein
LCQALEKLGSKPPKSRLAQFSLWRLVDKAEVWRHKLADSPICGGGGRDDGPRDARDLRKGPE